jgi:hypothetical protein
MIHRATAPDVERLKAELIARCRPYLRIERTLEQLLQAQDDATLAGLDSRTIGHPGAQPAVIELDRYRRAPTMVHDDGGDAA